MRHFVAALLGGVVAVVIGAVLIATGVIDTGETRVVRGQAPLAAGKESGGGLTVNQIYDKAGPGVASIRAEVVEQVSNPFGFPEQQRGEATGSGFVLNDDGYIATNAHVVNGARNVTVQFQGGPIPAKIVGIDVSTDLAVLKIDPSRTKLTPIPLGSSADVEVGDPVVAIGSPLGYDDTVTSGIVSNLQRSIDSPNQFTIGHAIQTDAAINPGNSGGPLLDANGRVIGINSQIATAGDGSKGFVGIGFAIPVDLAKKVIPQLIKNGHVPHAYIGVTTAPGQQPGAEVQSIEPGSPADRVGLAPGDVIVSVDGTDVRTPDDITKAIADDRPGDRAEIEVDRGGQKRTVTVTLADRPDDVAGDQQTLP